MIDKTKLMNDTNEYMTFNVLYRINEIYSVYHVNNTYIVKLKITNEMWAEYITMLTISELNPISLSLAIANEMYEINVHMLLNEQESYEHVNGKEYNYEV